MSNRTLRVSAAVLASFAVAACSGNSNRAGQDSAGAARADSQPGVNAPSDPTVMRTDPALRRDSSSSMSLPTDGPNRRLPPKKP